MQLNPYGYAIFHFAGIFFLVVIILSVQMTRVYAHEFWILPNKFQLKTGEKAGFTPYIGQNFKGEDYPRINSWINRFEVFDARSKKQVKGLDGDEPAGTVSSQIPGLKTVIYHSRPDNIVFNKWDKFVDYLQEEGLDEFKDRHVQLGKSQERISEDYIRCAKSLVYVGEISNKSADADRLTGMPLEFLAEKNPYRLKQGQKLPVRLFYQGQPLGGRMIKVLNKSAPDALGHLVTDREGRAKIPLTHSGEYLLNVVHMVPVPKGQKSSSKGDEKEVIDWQSYWASLTFSISK